MDDIDFSLFNNGDSETEKKEKTPDEIMAELGRDEPSVADKKKNGSSFSSSFCLISVIIGIIAFVVTIGCGTLLFYSVVSILGGTSSGGLLKFAAVCVLLGVIVSVAGMVMNTAVFIRNKKDKVKENLIFALVSLVSIVSGVITLSNVLVFLKILSNLATK